MSEIQELDTTDNGRLYANWDSYWDGFMTNSAIEFVRFNLIKNCINKLTKNFEAQEKMSFCELGAGTGVVSRYLGQKFKADIYVVDNNKKALAMSRETFKNESNYFEQIERDVFDLEDFKGRFDLVHSGGLIEHFVEEKREGIIKAHVDLVKDNGYVLILVPVHNFLYQILNEGIFKAMHLLDEIKEVPWSYRELNDILENYGFEIQSKVTVVTEIGILAKKVK